MAVSAILKGFDRSVGEAAERLEQFLRRPGALPVLIILLWACAVLPNLTVRSFIYEEGTNAEIARDVLANGHFLQPFVYGIRWHEKPSLLGWLIAGFALLTGGVNEWSARLPAMVSVLVTALLVQRVTRRYASLTASLFAALCFVFCPLLLQKLTIAEPDTADNGAVVCRVRVCGGRVKPQAASRSCAGSAAAFFLPRWRWLRDRSRRHFLPWVYPLIC